MIYCQLKLSSEAIKKLDETKGAIPSTFMHAFEENQRLTKENENLNKITDDYSQVKLFIDENREMKKVATESDQ